MFFFYRAHDLTFHGRLLSVFCMTIHILTVSNSTFFTLSVNVLYVNPPPFFFHFNKLPVPEGFQSQKSYQLLLLDAFMGRNENIGKCVHLFFFKEPVMIRVKMFPVNAAAHFTLDIFLGCLWMLDISSLDIFPIAFDVHKAIVFVGLHLTCKGFLAEHSVLYLVQTYLN